MRKSWIYKADGTVVERGEYVPADPLAPMVMPDIQPYTSMIDGRTIHSRSEHRAHLRQHNCIEIGNETKYLKAQPMTPPPGLKQRLIEVVNSKGY